MISVGTVIYLLDNKTHTIVPCLVVEKVNSISLDGEKTHHILKTPSSKSLKLEDYKHPWFKTTDDAKTFLIDTATALVNRTIDKAKALEKDTFGEVLSPQEAINKSKDDDENNYVTSQEESVFVELEDGTKAKVNIPTIPSITSG